MIMTMKIIMIMIMARAMILNKSDNYLMAVDEVVGGLQVPHALLRSPKTARSIRTFSVKIPMGLVERSRYFGLGRIGKVSIQKIWTTFSLAFRLLDFLLGDFDLPLGDLDFLFGVLNFFLGVLDLLLGVLDFLLGDLDFLPEDLYFLLGDLSNLFLELEFLLGDLDFLLGDTDCLEDSEELDFLLDLYCLLGDLDFFCGDFVLLDCIFLFGDIEPVLVLLDVVLDVDLL